MFKMIALSTLILSGSAFSQQCNDLGWTNQGVLISALQEVEELTDVKYLMIDSKKELVKFVIEGESKTKFVTYKTCGEEITFSKIQSL